MNSDTDAPLAKWLEPNKVIFSWIYADLTRTTNKEITMGRRGKRRGEEKANT